MRAACENMTFPAAASQHCQAYGDGFPTATRGFSFGTGREEVGNIKASSAQNATAMEELLVDPSIIRMATYPLRERRSFMLNLALIFVFVSAPPGVVLPHLCRLP
jgi:hypothetical protein